MRTACGDNEELLVFLVLVLLMMMPRMRYSFVFVVVVAVVVVAAVLSSRLFVLIRTWYRVRCNREGGQLSTREVDHIITTEHAVRATSA